MPLIIGIKGWHKGLVARNDVVHYAMIARGHIILYPGGLSDGPQ